MTTRTGLDAQAGFAKETTWNTIATPARFAEFNRESVKRMTDRVASAGIRAGKLNRARSQRYASFHKGAAGQIELEIHNKGSGFFLEHLLGSVATVQPDAGGNPTVYKHTASVGSLVGKSFTYQVGRPNVIDGTVHPFTYSGGKVASFEIKTDVGGLAICTMDCDFGAEDTATALAAASYPASTQVFTFVEGSLSIAAGAVAVRSASFAGGNGLKADRFYLGATKREQLDVGRDYRGTVDADFESLTAYNRFVNATEVALELLFQGATISGPYKYELRVTCPAVRFDGETPAVESVEEIKQPLPYVVLDDAMTIAYQTTDVTP